MKKLKDLSTKYDFKQVEAGKYDTWIKEGYFTPYRMLSSTQCCKDSAWMCYPDESEDKRFFPDCKCTCASVRPICKYLR